LWFSDSLIDEVSEAVKLRVTKLKVKRETDVMIINPISETDSDRLE
jgi:virulence-associated protein VagC